MSTVLELAKKLNKEFQNKNLCTLSNVVPEYKRLSVHPSLAYVTYGGLPYGRILTFSGVQHSGKTLAACTVIAAYQKENPDKMCVFIDVEHALDLQFVVKMTGINQEKLLYVNPASNMSGEQVLQMILEFYDSEDIGVVVLDSLPALVTGRMLEENDMEKDFGLRGHMAASYHFFLKQVSSKVMEKEGLLILINQVRVAGKTHTGSIVYSETSGSAPQFYSSVVLRFARRTFIKDDKTDLGDSQADGATGFRLKFAITKNKTAKVNRGAGFISYDYVEGIDVVRDTVEIALAAGLIMKPSNVTHILTNLFTGEVLKDENGKDLSFVGKGKLITYLKENKEFANWYAKMISDYMSKSELQSNLGSDEAYEEIKAQSKDLE